MNISVIIPVFNAEKYIQKAIESCLQLPEVKEIVVVDDGYKDNAKKIVKELAKKSSIIKLYEHPNNENRGAGPSRNLGIEKATQEYIAFLDADDYFLLNRFEKDRKVFEEKPDADGCYNAIDCCFYSEKAKEHFLNHFSSTTTSVKSSACPTPESLFHGLIGLIPNHGYFHLNGLTVKKDFLRRKKIAFPALSVHQDTVFIIKLAYYGKFYPANLNSAVALRGIHEENRITFNYQLEKRKNNNRYLMWYYLFSWGKQENIDKKELKIFKLNFTLHKMLSSSNPKLTNLIRPIFNDIRILAYPSYRKLIINNLTRLISSSFSKQKNKLNQLNM